MNQSQTRFVQEYLIDRNGTRAAIRAGYSEKTAASIAHELLRKPEIQAAVRKGEADLAKRAKISREAALKGFLEAIDIARAKSDPAGIVAGWREIAKMCGFYAPERKQVELSAAACAHRQRIADMSDEELAELIVAGAEAD